MQSINLPCLGVVLSGGLSSRMGTDKALLERHNENMLSFSCNQLKQANVSDVIVSGKQHGIADNIEHLGPMGGIYTIIQQFRPKALLILPVDLPLMTSDALQRLKQAGELSQKACFFSDSFLPLYLPITGFVEQFFTAKFSSLLSTSTKQKGPSIKSLIKQVPHQSVSIANQDILFNTNTPEEWSLAQQKFKHQQIKSKVNNV